MRSLLCRTPLNEWPLLKWKLIVIHSDQVTTKPYPEMPDNEHINMLWLPFGFFNCILLETCFVYSLWEPLQASFVRHLSSLPSPTCSHLPFRCVRRGTAQPPPEHSGDQVFSISRNSLVYAEAPLTSRKFSIIQSPNWSACKCLLLGNYE